jgi:hypothetical protein
MQYIRYFALFWELRSIKRLLRLRGLFLLLFPLQHRNSLFLKAVTIGLRNILNVVQPGY